MRHLLDVNVWFALLDEAHVFHAQALGFMQRRRVRTATCPLVENGVIRVFNLPGFSVIGPVGFSAVGDKLGEICAGMNHAFWPDDLSLRTPGVANGRACWATTRSPMSTCWPWPWPAAAAW